MTAAIGVPKTAVMPATAPATSKVLRSAEVIENSCPINEPIAPPVMMIGPSAPNGPPLPMAMPDEIGLSTATFGDIRLLLNRIASIASGMPWPRIFSVPKRAINPISSPPIAGTAMTARPRVLVAGEAARSDHAWKKNRLVNRRIRCSSAQAATALAPPTTAAMATMPGSRCADAKSRRSSWECSGSPAGEVSWCAMAAPSR